jgi:transposase
MNHVIHIAAATQIRLDTPGRAYYRRKLAAGKTRAEAMRCLKRRISDALYRQVLVDARALTPEGVNAGPRGHRGASRNSSAAGSHPHTDTLDQPLPGPAPTTLPAPTPVRKTTISRPLQPRLLTTEGCRNDATSDPLSVGGSGVIMGPSCISRPWLKGIHKAG